MFWNTKIFPLELLLWPESDLWCRVFYFNFFTAQRFLLHAFFRGYQPITWRTGSHGYIVVKNNKSTAHLKCRIVELPYPFFGPLASMGRQCGGIKLLCTKKIKGRTNIFPTIEVIFLDYHCKENEIIFLLLFSSS